MWYDGHEETVAVKLTAIGVIVVLTAINSLSVRLGARVQDLTTAMKLGALALIIVVGAVFLFRDMNTPGKPANVNYHASLNNSGESVQMCVCKCVSVCECCFVCALSDIFAT
jgi:amino acid transporter